MSGRALTTSFATSRSYSARVAPGLARRNGWSPIYAVGMGGSAVEARVSPYAALRLERTRTMCACGRRGVLQASMSAWRFVPVENHDG